jgi:hypothetical protein
MKVVSFPNRPARTHYRHELRTLAYVILDQANGGIVRNLNHQGLAVQAIAPLRQHQRVRLRFELKSPRVRVETLGEVSWATVSGACGIHFVDLPERSQRQIDEWIFSNLLESIERAESIREQSTPEETDGLILSSAPHPAIRLPNKSGGRDEARAQAVLYEAERHKKDPAGSALGLQPQPGWLSQPLSLRSIARLVDSLVVVAAVLLVAVIFLAIAHELPPWPLTLGAAAAVFVAVTYWGLFGAFGGASFGARLAQSATGDEDEGRPRKPDAPAHLLVRREDIPAD